MHVYFYARGDSPGGDVAAPYYQHEVVALAEGFAELGIPCFGNIDYWPTGVGGNTYLVKRADESMRETAAAVFVGSEYPFMPQSEAAASWASAIAARKKNIPCVFLARVPEFADQFLRASFLNQFDAVFLCDYNRAYRYPAHVYPWTFGLTKRIIAATQAASSHPAREMRAVWNFRCEHSSRALAAKKIKPVLEQFFSVDETQDSADEAAMSAQDALWLRHTNWRHYPAYYQKLCASEACAAFGGFFDAAMWGYHHSLVNRVASKLLRVLALPSGVLRQHDSWRMWEALAAGCVMICADLAKCGVVWPVMPKNYEHYIGVSPKEFLHPRAFEEKLRAVISSGRLRTIGEAGRSFVLEHYSPRACALRALEYLRIKL